MDWQLFLGTINYLGKFSSATAEVCEAVRRLKSVKAEWSRNEAYQDLYKKAKKANHERCMCEIL